MIWGHGNRMTAGESLDGSLGRDGTGRDKSMAVQTPKTMNRLMLYVECFNKWNVINFLNLTYLYLGKKNKGEKKKERKK